MLTLSQPVRHVGKLRQRFDYIVGQLARSINQMAMRCELVLTKSERLVNNRR